MPNHKWKCSLVSAHNSCVLQEELEGTREEEIAPAPLNLNSYPPQCKSYSLCLNFSSLIDLAGTIQFQDWIPSHTRVGLDLLAIYRPVSFMKFCFLFKNYSAYDIINKSLVAP